MYCKREDELTPDEGAGAFGAAVRSTARRFDATVVAALRATPLLSVPAASTSIQRPADVSADTLLGGLPSDLSAFDASGELRPGYGKFL
jgi:hypothetical protein